MKPDLLQLMFDLSRFEDETKILDQFTTRLNALWPEGAFSISPVAGPDAMGALPIARGRNIYGYLHFSLQDIRREDRDRLAQAVGLLAIMIENRVQARLLTESKESAAAIEERLILETRLSKLAATSPGVMFELSLQPDRSATFLYVSPASEDVYGITSADLLREPDLLFNKIQPEERQRISTLVMGCARDLLPCRFEFQLQHPLKGGIWIATHTSPIRDPDGSTRWYGFAFDITEQKNFEAQLRESEERYRSFFENAPVGIFQTSFNERIQRVNPALARMHGYASPKEMLEHVSTPKDLAVHDEDRAIFFRRIKEADVINAFEIEMYKKDGSTFWVSFNARVVKDENGTPLHFEGIVEDITEHKLAEEALHTSEERLRTIMENAQEIIHLIAWDGTFLFISPSWEHFTGFPVSETIGQSFTLYVHPDDVPACHEVVRKVRETGQPQKIMEFRVRHASGKWIWFMNSGVAIKDAQGEPLYFMGVAMDITERKLAEEGLLREFNFSRAAFDSLPGLLYLFDADGRLIRWNKNIGKLTGYTEEEIAAMSPLDLFGESERGLVQRSIEEIFTTGHSRVEASLIARDGTAMPHVISGNLLTYEGKPCLISMALDITERKRAEEALQASEVRLKEAQHIAQLGNWELDHLTNTLTWSDEIFRMFEIDKQNSGASYEMFINAIHPEDQAAVNDAFMQSLENRQHYNITHRLLMPDGRIKYVIEQCQTFYSEEGKPLRSVGTIQDVTERKHLEEQLLQAQKMEAVGQLAGGVAHDFNNLLQAILGYVELVLRDMQPTDKHYARLGEVKRAGERAATLTGQLLAFSRRQVLRLAPLDVNQVISELLQMLNRLIGEDIELIFMPCTSPLSVRADKGQIEQVLTNLCVNARDAMTGGGRLIIETSNIMADEVFIAEHAWAGPGPYLCISVTDTGCGMDHETLQQIFEPFFTTKEKLKGTGLGLAMVYGIISQHQGMIQVNSEVDQGTCFKIYLPAEITGFEEDHVQAEQIEAAGGTETILLAEDEEQIRDLAYHILTDAGYRVFLAADGQEALEVALAHAGEIDLLFLDVVMPKMSGRSVYDAVKAMNPSIKCLFASGYSRDGLHTDFVLEKGLNLLQKPYTRGALLRLIRQVLDGQS